MKAILALLLFACTLTSMRAEDELFVPPADADSCVPAVVYDSAVVYNSPVVYYAPVIYNAPVFYGVLVPDYRPTECEPEAPSIVIHIGGGQSYTTANYGDCASTVIHFGGGQAASQGYHFGHR